LWDGGKQVLRQFTYWQMKSRAGVVGKDGLARLIKRVHDVQPDLKIHLVGHSFGGRLVSFSLAGLPPEFTGNASPVKSMLLLQAAFSHFAFAGSLPHDPARSGALAGQQGHVDGPIGVTHSLHDSAVCQLYPAASFSAGQDAAGVDDLMYRWQAMGQDGAQAVSAENQRLEAVGYDYPWEDLHGKFVNLDGNNVIVRGGPPSGAHSDIIHSEIAWASLSLADLAAS
jgi:pimeloyl-ACP methyl ester carboxylesterase